MRIVVSVLLLLLVDVGWSQEAPQNPLDLGGVTTLLADKVKEAKGASTINGRGQFGGAAYLPVWVFHDATNDYLELGGGGQILEGEHVKGFLTIAVNLPALSAWVFRSAWSQAHIRRSVFPPVWVGPYFNPDFSRPASRWVIGDLLGGMVSVRLGPGK